MIAGNDLAIRWRPLTSGLSRRLAEVKNGTAPVLYQAPQPLTYVGSGMCGQRSLAADAFPSWPGLTRPSPGRGTMRRAADHADVSGDGRVKPYRVHTSREYSGPADKVEELSTG